MLLVVVVFFCSAHGAQMHFNGYQYPTPNQGIYDYNGFSTTPTPIITKQFYSVSAPNDDEHDDDDDDNEAVQRKHLIIGRPMRNYRVIFIRTPSPDNAKIRYTAELAPQEERTVIYVLTRKQKELEAQDILTTAEAQRQQPSKPEVFFIKYKTNAEAMAAQQSIQAQYDQLDGVTGEYTSERRIAPLQTAEELINGQTKPSVGYEYNKPPRALQGQPFVL